MTEKPPDDLLARFRAGQRLALARAISRVEGRRPGFQELLHAVLQGDPRAVRVGLTGPPGAGKSSLVSALCRHYRSTGEEIGVVAVDPSSPYSGGALLGDRIRMNDLATDPGVFIRSMATRGSLGGLATTTREVVDLMDAFGFPRVLVETVGVGQTELEITRAADTVVVVLVPESGDGIQAMKAGLMEIADIFVVNKADRPGAGALAKELRGALELRAGGGDEDGWGIPVLETRAHKGEGVVQLAETLARHRAFLEESGRLAERRRARAADRIRDVLAREFQGVVEATVRGPSLQRDLDEIASGAETPYSVAQRYLGQILGPGAQSNDEEPV